MWERLCLLAMLLFSGCAAAEAPREHFEYDLLTNRLRPQHIAEGQVYHVHGVSQDFLFATVRNHLGVLIYNPTTQPLELVGDQSSIIDPAGVTHPLASRMILPHTYTVFVLPSIPSGHGPSSAVSIELNESISRYADRDSIARDLGDIRYSGVPDSKDADDASFVTWEGETEVQLNLRFKREDHIDRLEYYGFSFHRKKVTAGPATAPSR